MTYPKHNKIFAYTWHHFWLGLLIAIGGFWMWDTHPQTGSALALIGVLIALDDVVQHILGNSPLRIIYNQIKDRIP